MEYRLLGRTGVKVSSLCLGTMMLGTWGNPDHEESIRIIHRALDAGINFIDTADIYSDGESEEIVAKALSGGRRDNVVLATKVHGSMGGHPNEGGNSRRWILAEVESSLRRLKTDWIDLYQIHRPEDETEIGETLSALTSSRRNGSRGSGDWSGSSPSSRHIRSSSGGLKPTSCRPAPVTASPS
jgi:aryl-alcohol dehydrogenase-like predicted oxidoreductase